jgi:adenine-specific DNA methylase
VRPLPDIKQRFATDNKRQGIQTTRVARAKDFATPHETPTRTTKDLQIARGAQPAAKITTSKNGPRQKNDNKLFVVFLSQTKKHCRKHCRFFGAEKTIVVNIVVRKWICKSLVVAGRARVAARRSLAAREW